jgi:ubiquinone/menaquinone biosynthesis C-methylase UbiE
LEQEASRTEQPDVKSKIINNETTKVNWNGWSDEYFAKEYSNPDTLKTLKFDPSRVFPKKVLENILAHFPNLSGIKVCVPSSGDNKAAFGFHLLGAEVTSCDISERQMMNARHIADSEGWNIGFHVCDSMELAGIDDNKYDLVYTSNGVHVWISDLEMMYGNFNRVLKPGGSYIFFETHPFNRPFDDSTNELRITKPYNQTEPSHHWRVQDFINALISGGFSIERMDELFAEKNTLGANWWDKTKYNWDEKADWQKNPYAALPQWLSICTKK